MLVTCVRERQEGKTELLLELLRENPDAVMVVMSGQLKKHTLQMMGPNWRNFENRIFIIDDLDKLRGRKPGPILFDDFDNFLFNFFSRYHHPTEIVATATGKSI